MRTQARMGERRMGLSTACWRSRARYKGFREGRSSKSGRDSARFAGTAA